MFDDIRQFLAYLSRHGQLLDVDDEVQPEPDIAAAACAANRLGENSPALLFRNIRGYPGARISMNVHGSWPNHALALGMPPNTGPREQVIEFAKRYARFPGEISLSANPVWSENGAKSDIDLFALLPLFRLNAGDGGYFIDKACVVSRDPAEVERGPENVGIYRLQVKGPRKLGIQPVPTHDIAVHLRHAEERGVDLPVAICIGNEPLISLVAGMPIEFNQSEYKMAAALRGAPYPVGRTPLYDLLVPHGSEIVLEGRIKAGVREPEGPFGEFTGFYSGGRQMPVIEIDGSNYRNDPIFENLYIGKPWTEVDYMVAINTCVPIYRQLKEISPEVVAVNAMYTHGFVVIVSMKPHYPGAAKNVALRLLSTPHGQGYAKIVIVVDADVNPFDLPQVMWSLATKFNAEFDLLKLDGMPIMKLDPSSVPPGRNTKLIFDATTPFGNGSKSPTRVDDPITTDLWIDRFRSGKIGRPLTESF